MGSFSTNELESSERISEIIEEAIVTVVGENPRYDENL